MGPPTALHSLFFLTMMWHNHLITIKHDQHISKYIKIYQNASEVGWILAIAHILDTYPIISPMLSESTAMLNHHLLDPGAQLMCYLHTETLTATCLDMRTRMDQRWQNMPVPPDQKAPKIKSLNVMNMIIVIKCNKSNVMREFIEPIWPIKIKLRLSLVLSFVSFVSPRLCFAAGASFLAAEACPPGKTHREGRSAGETAPSWANYTFHYSNYQYSYDSSNYACR